MLGRVCVCAYLSDRHQSIGKFAIIWQNGRRWRAFQLLWTSPNRTKKHTFHHLLYIDLRLYRERHSKLNVIWYKLEMSCTETTTASDSIILNVSLTDNTSHEHLSSFCAVQMYWKSNDTTPTLSWKVATCLPYAQILMFRFAVEHFASNFRLGSIYIWISKVFFFFWLILHFRTWYRAKSIEAIWWWWQKIHQTAKRSECAHLSFGRMKTCAKMGNER